MNQAGNHQDGRLVETTPMRAAIGRRMSLSKKEIPHAYFQTDIVVDAALAQLDALNADPDVKVTVSALLARATALALREHPAFNAHWTDEDPIALNESRVRFSRSTVWLNQAVLDPPRRFKVRGRASFGHKEADTPICPVHAHTFPQYRRCGRQRSRRQQ